MQIPVSLVKTVEYENRCVYFLKRNWAVTQASHHLRFMLYFIITIPHINIFIWIIACGLMICIASSWIINGITLNGGVLSEISNSSLRKSLYIHDVVPTATESSTPSYHQMALLHSEHSHLFYVHELNSGPSSTYFYLVTLARTTCVSSAAVRRWQTWHTSEQ